MSIQSQLVSRTTVLYPSDYCLSIDCQSFNQLNIEYYTPSCVLGVWKFKFQKLDLSIKSRIMKTQTLKKLSGLIFLIFTIGITSFKTPENKTYIGACRMIKPINDQGNDCKYFDNHVGFIYESGSSYSEVKSKLTSSAGSDEVGLRTALIQQGNHLHVLKVKNIVGCNSGCSRIEYYFGIGYTQAAARQQAERDYEFYHCPGKSQIVQRWEKGF